MSIRFVIGVVVAMCGTTVVGRPVVAQTIAPGRVGPPIRQTASLDSMNDSSTSGTAETVTAGDGRRMDVKVDITGPADTVEIVGPDGTATDTVQTSGMGRETIGLDPPSRATLMNTTRGQVTIRVISAGRTVGKALPRRACTGRRGTRSTTAASHGVSAIC